MKKKLFLVKREVWAKSMKEALTAKGRIYEIQECEKQPDEPKQVGFKKSP